MFNPWIDISLPLSNNIPIWPGSPGMEHIWLQRIENGGVANVSQLRLELHTSTHVDAPLHFIKSGKSIDEIPLELLCGKCQIVNILHKESISAEDLQQANIHPQTRRLLIRTENSERKLLENINFDSSFSALTSEAADWIVANHIQLVGIDYLSIQKFTDGPETHQILLGNEVIIVETLNLVNVKSGFYEMVCLPIPLKGAEASPARVLIRKLA